MFRRIRYPIKNIWRNGKRYNSTIPSPKGPSGNNPNTNNLFVTIITCICIYSINKNKK
jgi:hypothetical protein